MKKADPYKQLAWHLISNYPDTQIKENLLNPDFFLKILQDEFRDIDYIGAITDTIIADHSTMDGAIWLHQTMDKSAALFFEGLDLARLRREIALIYLNM